jgi:N-acetylneuraminic acid mutarotase
MLREMASALLVLAGLSMPGYAQNKCNEGLHLNPDSLSLQARQGQPNPPKKKVDLTFHGTGSVTWTATADKPWIQVSPSFGTISTETRTLTISTPVHQDEAWIGPTSMTNAPGARNGHVAVWTGLEMFVPWGWNDGPDNDIFHYNPIANTWTGPTTSFGACPVRWRATSVWTGKEIIVWGGSENVSGGNVSTGYRYYPSTNTWSWISPIGAPTARRGHTAVWTGTEMLVWGGGDDNGLCQTGGRYNPQTDTWGTPLTTVGAPARGGHAAVWTGTEMVIWGGGDASVGNNDVNTGMRYDPVQDMWLGPISSVGAPESRDFCCAAWTGKEMVIWGGNDGNYPGGMYLNTGGRYDPSTDTWAAMSTDGAPSPRDGVSGVWTGSEVVLFGGHNGATPLNDGARYQPPINLPPGTYMGTVTVSDISSRYNPQTVHVTLIVRR